MTNGSCTVDDLCRLCKLFTVTYAIVLCGDIDSLFPQYLILTHPLRKPNKTFCNKVIQTMTSPYYNLIKHPATKSYKQMISHYCLPSLKVFLKEKMSNGQGEWCLQKRFWSLNADKVENMCPKYIKNKTSKHTFNIHK